MVDSFDYGLVKIYFDCSDVRAVYTSYTYGSLNECRIQQLNAQYTGNELSSEDFCHMQVLLTTDRASNTGGDCMTFYIESELAARRIAAMAAVAVALITVMTF